MKRNRAVLYVMVPVAVLLAAFVVVLATRKPATDRRVQSALIGKPAPATAGPTIDGKTFDVAEASGQWVVVNFFATWCVPCRKEHPELRRFQEAHAASGDATVVSVVFDDPPSTVRKFFEEFGGDWPVIQDDKAQISLDYGVSGVPESYLIAPDGKVYAKIIGGVTKEGLDKILAEVSGAGSAEPTSTTAP